MRTKAWLLMRQFVCYIFIPPYYFSNISNTAYFKHVLLLSS